MLPVGAATLPDGQRAGHHQETNQRSTQEQRRGPQEEAEVSFGNIGSYF